jgi:hypothetical protein
MPTSTRHYAENVSAPGSSPGSIGPTHHTCGSLGSAYNLAANATAGNVGYPEHPGVDKQ